MARPAAGIGEGLTPDGHELPGVRPIPQRQLQHAERAAVANLAIGEWRAEGIQTAAARAHDERADTALGVELTARRLWREALILVVVPGDGDLPAKVVQRLPEGLNVAVAAVIGPRAEPGVVHVGDRGRRGIRGCPRPDASAPGTGPTTDPSN